MDLFVKKRGQLGLVDIFSMILYFVVVLIIILMLNIAGCFIKTKAEAAIGVNVNLAKSVSADSQLASFLRTDMSDATELRAKLDWLKNSKKNNPDFPDFSKEIGVKFADAQGFLDSHPELYEKKDYSEFISALYVFYQTGAKKDKESVEKAFRAVTAAMFLRVVKDYPKKGEYIFYLLPVGVKFKPDNLMPSNKADICQDYDLCVDYLPSEIVPQTQDPFDENGITYVPINKIASQSVQAVPLPDYTFAKIEFRYYVELPSTLPQA